MSIHTCQDGQSPAPGRSQGEDAGEGPHRRQTIEAEASIVAFSFTLNPQWVLCVNPSNALAVLRDHISD